MFEKIVAIAVPIVGVIGALRWPTLERRVRSHVALMNELPKGLSSEYRTAVEAELAELARRIHFDLQQRNPIQRFLKRTVIAGIIVGTIFALTGGGYALLLQDRTSTVVMYVCAIVCYSIVLLLAIAGLVHSLLRRDYPPLAES